MATRITGSGNSIDSRITGCFGIAEGVAGGGVLQADRARRYRPRSSVSISWRWLACICRIRPIRSLLSLDRVVNGGAGVDGTGVNAEEAEFADKGVGRDLERESREGLVVGRMTVILFPGVGVDTLDCGDVGRSRHIVDDRVQQLLHALVAVGGSRR